MKSLTRQSMSLLPIAVAWVLLGCGSGPAHPTPLATPTPAPPVDTGSFAVTSSLPSSGAFINVADHLAHSGPDLTFRFTFSADIPQMHWEIDLLQGSQKCLATQSAYATRRDGGPSSGYSAEYKAGSAAIFQSSFWVLQDCGTSFVTDHLLFTVIGGDAKQLFQQTVDMGWTFHP